MHPKVIVENTQKYGSDLLLDNGELFLKNPENIPWEIEEFIVSHKQRLVDYLNGKFTERQHAIDQTIEKMFLWWRGIEQPGSKTIQYWTVSVPESIGLLYELSAELAKQGWKNPDEPYFPYETERSREIAEELYDSAVAFANRRR